MATLHFLHVGKTGGTAIKRALRSNGLAYWRPDDEAGVPPTPYGRIQLHNHRFGLDDVPENDFVFFCVRDPVTRFVSAFYSRLNKGQPRYFSEWTPGERRAFEAFPTPQRLAVALMSSDARERRLARRAMRRIRHLGFMYRHVGTPSQLHARRRQVVFIGKQETLDRDWEKLKEVLDLPGDVRLPTGRVRAHRRAYPEDAPLDAQAIAALRSWYGGDYRLLAYCDRLRIWRGWDQPPATGVGRLARELARLRGVRAALPPIPEPLDRPVPRP